MSSYKRLLPYIKTHALALIICVLCVLALGYQYNQLVGLPKYIESKFFDPGEPLKIRDASIAVAIIPLLIIVYGIFDFFTSYALEKVGQRVVADLRIHLFAHIQRLSIGYFSGSRSGDLISRTVNDTSQLERVVSNALTDLVKSPVLLIAALVGLIQNDPKLALLGVMTFPFCIIAISLMGRKVRRNAREGQERLADLTSILQENIAGVRVVKGFGMESTEADRFVHEVNELCRRMLKISKARALMPTLTMLISSFGVASVLIYAAVNKVDGAVVMQFFTCLVALYKPARELTRIPVLLQQSAASADRVFELLDTPIEVVEDPNAREPSMPVRTIQFDHVSFAYRDKPVLQDIHFTVKAGEFIALVGSSGSGKSTLLSLLPRFYDPVEGRLLFNGDDARKLRIKPLRAMIGIVSQDNFLFNDTIRANIAYGSPGATQGQIEDASKRALAHEFILEKPRGYDTIVGERGVQLSGGQIQRIAIARAILRNPAILILDEATSALDTESERHVQAALEQLMTGRTVFAIAHRLSTVMHADRIIVLQEGRIVEMGTHAELMAREGLYRHFHSLQFRETA